MILFSVELSAKPKIFSHEALKNRVGFTQEGTSACRTPTGDNEYKREEATKLQANLKQPVTWYYALVGGSRPIVFSLFITSPLTLCGRHRLVLAAIEYYVPSSKKFKQKSTAYKALSGFSIIDTKDWDQSQLLNLSITDNSGRKWKIERLENSTNISVDDISFSLDDNNSMYPQGVAPTSFNRASKSGYSTSYVTSFLNTKASGVIEGVAFEDAFSYFEHVDTAAFSPLIPTTLSEQTIEWACLYISHEKSPFMFQGCADWKGSYNPFTIGTLVDASGKRSGFTNPGFELKPIDETLFMSNNAQMEFYGAYTIDINFGGTSFSARTIPQIPQTDFGVSTGSIRTYIQPVFFERQDGKGILGSRVTGILEQVRMKPSSFEGLIADSSEFIVPIETFKLGLKEYLSTLR